MKTLRIAFALMIVLAALGFAADITGMWVAENKMTTPNGDERTITITFDLKADGAKLTGTVLTVGGMGKREPTPVEIQDGKIDGNKVSFMTVVQSQRGERKTRYEATIDGDQMTGTSAVEGAPEGRTMKFTAKKQ